MSETHPSDGTAEPQTRGARLLREESSLRAQSSYLVAARLVKAAVGIVVPVVLTRIFDQATYGHFKQIGLIVATLLNLLSLGLPGSLYYFVPRSPRSSQSLVQRSVLLLGLLGLAGGVATYLARDWLGEVFAAPLASHGLLLALIVALSAPASIAEVVGVVDRRAQLSALATASLEALRALLIVLLALLTADLAAVLAAWLLSLVAQLAYLGGYVLWRRRQRPDDREPFRSLEHVRYALPFFGASLIGLARDQLHAYYVAIEYSAAEFAVYAVGTLSIPFIGRLTQSVAEVVVIDASRSFAAGELAQVRRVWWRGTLGVATALLPAFALLFVFAGDLLALAFGELYRPAATVFRIHICMLPLGALLSSAMLRASAQLRTMAAADTASLVATIAALFALAPSLGPAGAVLALVLGRLVFNGVAAWAIAGKLDVGVADFLPWRWLAALTLSAFASFGLAAWFVQALPLGLRVPVGVGLGGALCVSALWWGRLLPDPERETLVRLVGRLLQRIGRGPGEGPPG